VAELAGIELDEWQGLTVDVAMEYEPGSRRWIRRTVVYVVSRQNGKTVVFKSRVLVGLFAIPTDKLILHTAQDRTEPRKMFMELVETITEVPAFRKRLKPKGIRLANGQESIELKDGSKYRIVAPREKSFRGPSADVILFDEIREHRDTALWGAALPTQSARPNPQVWATSNAGDADAVQLAALQHRGRTAAELGEDPSIAYLEWSAHPDRAPDDPKGWIEANPGLGSRITSETISEELRSLDPVKFETERLCRSVIQRSAPAIPWPKWEAAGGEPDPVELGLPRPVLGIHINGERTHASLAMVADRDGRLVADLIQEWRDPDGVDLNAITADVLTWIRHYRVRDLAFDRAASSVVASAASKKITVHQVTRVGFVIASQVLLDAVSSGWLLHRHNPELDAQIRSAGRKDRDDGSWFISQAASPDPIPGVLALAFATELAYRPKANTGIHSAGSK